MGSYSPYSSRSVRIAEQHALQRARGREREHEARCARDGEDPERSRYELRDDVTLERADRDSQSDLASPQADDVAQRSVQTEARERERRSGEQREHDGTQAVLRVRVADLLL
jgi:hypothetical protein